jgi:hypothetical protein
VGAITKKLYAAVLAEMDATVRIHRNPYRP